MGAVVSSVQTSNPNYDNVCTNQDKIGQVYTIPNIRVQTQAEAEAACQDLSSEWESEIKIVAPTFPVLCIRESFNGDPKQCCVNNYDAIQQRSLCFSDSAEKDTCDPTYRSATGNGCQDLFIQYCLNEPQPTDVSFTAAWSDPSNFCAATIANNVELASGDPAPASNISWANDAMNQVFSKYFTAVGGIQQVGQAGQFQGILYSLCSQYPTACATALNNQCAQYTRNQAGGNQNIVNFCGCHMASSVYALYENSFGISQECDPLCARPNTVPVTSSTGEIQKCQSSICIIDDITFELVNSQAGNINFQQACGACSSTGTTSTCNCSISGVTVDVANSELGNVNLSQLCGGSLNCYQQPTSGSTSATQVNCNTGQPISGGGSSSGGQSISNYVWFALIGILILAGIFLFIVLIINSRENKINKPIPSTS